MLSMSSSGQGRRSHAVRNATRAPLSGDRMIAIWQLVEMRGHKSRTRRSTNMTGRSTVLPPATEPEQVSSDVAVSPERRCLNATRTHDVPGALPEFVNEQVLSSPPASHATRIRAVPAVPAARQPMHETPPTTKTSAPRPRKAAMIPQPIPHPVENALRGWGAGADSVDM